MLPRCKLNLCRLWGRACSATAHLCLLSFLAPLVKFELEMEQNSDGQAETQHT